MSSSLAQQAKQLYEVFAELVRGYQFRDREGICCHGVSVSQCYTLDTLARRGVMQMGELADELFLEISTVTRIIDQLVLRQLVVREFDPNDRRVRRIRITPKGKSLVAGVRSSLIKEHEKVLRGIAPSSRDAVIAAMAELLAAFNKRQQCPSNEEDGERKRCHAG